MAKLPAGQDSLATPGRLRHSRFLLLVLACRVYPATGSKLPALCTCPRLLTELPGEPLRALDKSIQVDPRLVPHPRKRYTESSVAMLPVAFGAKGQPPYPPPRRRAPSPRFDGHRRVRYPRVASVVEVAAYDGSEDALDESFDLARHTDSYGVGEYDLIWLRRSYSLGQIQHNLWLYSALKRAPEGGGERNGDAYSVQPRPLDEDLSARAAPSSTVVF